MAAEQHNYGHAVEEDRSIPDSLEGYQKRFDMELLLRGVTQEEIRSADGRVELMTRHGAHGVVVRNAKPLATLIDSNHFGNHPVSIKRVVLSRSNGTTNETTIEYTGIIKGVTQDGKETTSNFDFNLGTYSVDGSDPRFLGDFFIRTFQSLMPALNAVVGSRILPPRAKSA